MMIRKLVLLFWAVLCALPADAGHGQLHAFFIDVEGGQSALIVGPNKHALLIDAGWDSDGRDAARIMQAITAAGVQKLDGVLVTHFHRDHAGGIPDLLKRIQANEIIDHGSSLIPYPGSEQIMNAYTAAIRGIPHRIARPGDRFAVGELRVFVVASSGQNIHKPLPGVSGEKSDCEHATMQVQEKSENIQSVAVLVRFGNFRLYDGGDLLWNAEQALVCPKNLLGHVDAIVLSHHGEDTATPPALIRAISPRAAIMSNGEKKGGSNAVQAMLHDANVDLWQIHYSAAMGPNNAPEAMIANPKGSDDANDIELTAEKNGNFTVTNRRNGYRKRYPRHGHPSPDNTRS